MRESRAETPLDVGSYPFSLRLGRPGKDQAGAQGRSPSGGEAEVPAGGAGASGKRTTPERLHSGSRAPARRPADPRPSPACTSRHRRKCPRQGEAGCGQARVRLGDCPGGPSLGGARCCRPPLLLTPRIRIRTLYTDTKAQEYSCLDPRSSCLQGWGAPRRLSPGAALPLSP